MISLGRQPQEMDESKKPQAAERRQTMIALSCDVLLAPPGAARRARTRGLGDGSRADVCSGGRATLWLFRLGWRPPARHQRGRRPSGLLTNDHADGATLGRQGRPRRPELPGDLLTEERTELLLSWRHTGFSVHNRVRVEPEDQPAVERLARYVMRLPISLEQMQWGGDGEVLYRPKGGHDGRCEQPGDAAEAFDRAEFLVRVIMHIPEPRRHLVRYSGAYSNVSRGKRRQQEEGAISSRSTKRGSSPRRFLNLLAAAAACAGCAHGGGNEARDRGSRLLCRGRLSRPPVPADSGGRSTRRHLPWGPKTGLNAVLALCGMKGNSYPSFPRPPGSRCQVAARDCKGAGQGHRSALDR